MLTYSTTAVKKRCTLTWSLSATSTPANPLPQVFDLSLSDSRTLTHVFSGHLIYKCGGIDKRTIEKFEKVRYSQYWRRFLREPESQGGGKTFSPALTDKIFLLCCAIVQPASMFCSANFNGPRADVFARKRPRWAKAPSSMHGFSTS